MRFSRCSTSRERIGCEQEIVLRFSIPHARNVPSQQLDKDEQLAFNLHLYFAVYFLHPHTGAQSFTVNTTQLA